MSVVLWQKYAGCYATLLFHCTIHECAWMIQEARGENWAREILWNTKGKEYDFGVQVLPVPLTDK